MNKKALLLLNLGTPAAPTKQAVGQFLKKFLMDKYVIDAPFLFRWLLVHNIIVPGRVKKSAKAYQSIWGDEGSPLLALFRKFSEKVKVKMMDQADVYWAMRYGEPSIKQTVLEIREKNYDEIYILPLYPQYALSSTESSLQEVRKHLKGSESHVYECPYFFEEKGFINCLADKLQNFLQTHPWDHILFSYHNLPINHLTKACPDSEFCTVRDLCCSSVREDNEFCYRVQCLQTTKNIAEKLKLNMFQYSLSFQSGLEGAKWIQPYTEHMWKPLVERGIKNLVVLCPSFVTDCLETLEEIQMRAKEDFIGAGGQDLFLMPCLNDDDLWVEQVAQYIHKLDLWRTSPQSVTETSVESLSH